MIYHDIIYQSFKLYASYKGSNTHSHPDGWGAVRLMTTLSGEEQGIELPTLHFSSQPAVSPEFSR